MGWSSPIDGAAWLRCDWLHADNCEVPAPAAAWFASPLLTTRSFTDALRAVCNASASPARPVLATLSLVNAAADGNLARALDLSPHANRWVHNWHRDTEATHPYVRHVFGAGAVLLSGAEAVVASAVAGAAGCWGGGPPAPLTVDVAMMEEEAGLVHTRADCPQDIALHRLWTDAASVATGHFRLYRPYALLGLSPDVFQVLPQPKEDPPSVRCPSHSCV